MIHVVAHILCVGLPGVTERAFAAAVMRRIFNVSGRS